MGEKIIKEMKSHLLVSFISFLIYLKHLTFNQFFVNVIENLGGFVSMNKQKLFSWVIVALWMAMIFYFSAQVANQSEHLSSGVSRMIIGVIEKIIPDAAFDMDLFNHIVRKNAHFFVYLILGGLVFNALKRSGFQGVRSIGVAILICFLYAVSDELHQLFVPGRAGQVKDVLIDSSGACVGILVRWIIGKKWGRDKDVLKLK